MKKTIKNKLHLNAATIRALDIADLARAGGGIGTAQNSHCPACESVSVGATCRVTACASNCATC